MCLKIVAVDVSIRILDGLRLRSRLGFVVRNVYGSVKLMIELLQRSC
jgi:hypothetical protein